MGTPSPRVTFIVLCLTGIHCGVCLLTSMSVAMKKLIQLGQRFRASPTAPPRLSITE